MSYYITHTHTHTHTKHMPKLCGCSCSRHASLHSRETSTSPPAYWKVQTSGFHSHRLHVISKYVPSWICCHIKRQQLLGSQDSRSQKSTGNTTSFGYVVAFRDRPNAQVQALWACLKECSQTPKLRGCFEVSGSIL